MREKMAFCCVLVAAALSLMSVADGSQRRSDDVSPVLATVERLSQDVVGLRSQLTAQIEAQNNKIEAQRQRIAALEAANNNTVAFCAHISEDSARSIRASQGSVVPFRTVISNVGDAYNPVTSSFTAPRAAQYYFAVHADCSHDYRAIHVNVNGHAVFAAHNDGAEDYHITAIGLVMLNAGDVVTATHENSVGSLDEGFESTFTGFLVK